MSLLPLETFQVVRSIGPVRAPTIRQTLKAPIMTITPDSKQDSAAPPSYAAAVAGAGPSSQRAQQPPPARTYSPSGNEQSHLHQPQRTYHSGGNAEEQWVPPSSESEVRSRARKRFFIAALWAFGIYTLLGYVLHLVPGSH